jgi:hypothetical protein
VPPGPSTSATSSTTVTSPCTWPTPSLPSSPRARPSGAPPSPGSASHRRRGAGQVRLPGQPRRLRDGCLEPAPDGRAGVGAAQRRRHPVRVPPGAGGVTVRPSPERDEDLAPLPEPGQIDGSSAERQRGGLRGRRGRPRRPQRHRQQRACPPHVRRGRVRPVQQPDVAQRHQPERPRPAIPAVDPGRASARRRMWGVIPRER